MLSLYDMTFESIIIEYPLKFQENRLLGAFLVAASYVLVFITFPVSIFFCIKVGGKFTPMNYKNLKTCYQIVNEYERAVIFRLGRLRSGSAKGPGMYFILPLVDSYRLYLCLRNMNIHPNILYTKGVLSFVLGLMTFLLKRFLPGTRSPCVWMQLSYIR